MKRIRIGKDIKIVWKILTNLKPLSLEEKDIRLVLTTPLGRKSDLPFHVSNDIVYSSYPGILQKETGVYKLTLWVNYGKPGQSVVDNSMAFKIVSSTCQEPEQDINPEETVTACGNLIVGVTGDSAYEIAVRNGFVGSEKEWLESLKGGTTSIIPSFKLKDNMELEATYPNSDNTDVERVVIGKVAVTPKREYEEDEIYNILDIVGKDGCSYISKKSANTDPPENDESWLCIAKKGDSIKYEDLTPEQLEELQKPATKSAEALSDLGKRLKVLVWELEELEQISNLRDYVYSVNEDDIEIEDGYFTKKKIKFADRKYDPSKYSGKGYKILRKNIVGYTVKLEFEIESGCTNNGTITVSVNGISYDIEITSDSITAESVAQLISSSIPGSTLEGNVITFNGETSISFSTTGIKGKVTNRYISEKNVLTQDMINEANTVYEIRYDFDLNEKEINIPEGCILKFEGGLLHNGVVIGNNTNINTEINKIFHNIVLKGLWKVKCAYPEWFGAIGDGINDDSTSIQDCINLFNIIYLTNKYAIKEININKSVIFNNGELLSIPIRGNSRNIFSSTTENIDIIFNNVKINGNSSELFEEKVDKYNNLIRIENARNVEFINCEIFNHAQYSDTDEIEWAKRYIYAINLFECDNVVFNNCYFHNNRTEQIAIGSYSEKTLCKITNCSCNKNEQALALFLLFGLKEGIITNNTFYNNYRTFINIFSDNLIIANNIFIKTTSRGITTENYGDYYHMKNIIVDNNIIKDCQQGGINIGIDSCFITNNKIYNCNNYGIAAFGNKVGNIESANEAKKALPYANFEFVTTYNITIKNNEIHNIPNNPESYSYGIYIRGMLEYTEDIINWGTTENVIIENNIIDGNEILYPLRIGNINVENLNIINNTIYNNGKNPPMLFSIKNGNNISIMKNNIKIVDNSLNVIRFDNYCDYINNIILEDNICNIITQGDFLAVQKANTLGSIISVKNNITLGSDQIPDNINAYKDNKIPLFENIITIDNLYEIPDKVSYRRGDVIKSTLYQTASGNIYKYINHAGTTGILEGVKCNIQENKNYIEILSNIENLKIGDYLNIQSTKYKIYKIEKSENKIYVSPITKSNGNNIDVQYYNPTFYNTNYSGIGISSRNSQMREVDNGAYIYSKVNNQAEFWDGEAWRNSNGENADIKKSGIFSKKPSEFDGIKIGYSYFCTDKQTSEGSTNGIMIYYKGNNVWVDALGRIVS